MKSLHRVAASRWVKPNLVAMAVIALFAGHLTAPGATAGIIGINSISSSSASITFDDTNSIGPPAGITNTGPWVSPWNGATVTLTTTTDPNTGDFATGSIDASFIPSSNTYAINFSGITLSQPSPTTTGFAILNFNFSVDYQLDALGLPSQATLFPNFVVNGTVQSSPGSFAAIKGFIDYYGVTTPGAISPLDTVVYNAVWTTPGSFSAVVTGTPSGGTTAALMPSTFLLLRGSITFTVDPATVNAYSVQSVPEPGSITLMASGIAALAFCAHRRRRRSSGN